MTLSEVNFEYFWGRLDKDVRDAVEQEFSWLVGIHKMLLPYDLHYGYRTMNEMLLKLYRNNQLTKELQLDKKAAVERVICEKVLPKLRGD